MSDYLRYYDLESYLFDDVGPAYRVSGVLTAFDFFSIVIWKSNRAKSKVARRLLAKAPSDDLHSAVRELSRALFYADTDEERLRILMVDWKLRLPMATAVLTVLWPSAFTVYDVRACDELGAYHQLANLTAFNGIWTGYQEFRAAIREAGPDGLSLRDKDRFLWARSSANQLRNYIATAFTNLGEDA